MAIQGGLKCGAIVLALGRGALGSGKSSGFVSPR